jgi:transcriptional regulator with XRE-family HTH domain
MDKDKLTPENRSAFSLRVAFERTQKEIAAVLGLKDGAQLSLFEKGHRPLSYEYLEEIAASLKVPPEGVEALLFAHRLLWELRSKEAAGEGRPEVSPLDPTAEERSQMWRTAIAGAWSVAETLYSELVRRSRAEKVERALAQAELWWSRLQPLWQKEGRDLVMGFPALRTPALVARICEASARAAARSFEDAQGLADFALFLAEQLPGGKARRARALGYCRLFRANALRVATEFDLADAELREGWKLWQEGDPSEPEILSEWRLHALSGGTGVRRAGVRRLRRPAGGGGAHPAQKGAHLGDHGRHGGRPVGVGGGGAVH